MAGLLENEEAQAIAQAEQMPVEQQPAPENGEGDDFKDPALQRAIAYMGDRLYGKDKLAERQLPIRYLRPRMRPPTA